MDIPKLPNDVLVSIALELNLPTLLRFCQGSKRFNRLTCDSFSFWFNKTKRDLGFTYTKEKSVDKIKDFYRKIADLKLTGRIAKAARKGDLGAVKFMINKTTDENFKAIALFTAVIHGHLDIVKYIVQLGISKKDISTAFVSASAGGHLEIVKYLLENGADIHHRDDNALRQATYGGRLDVVEYLISKGANVNIYY